MEKSFYWYNVTVQFTVEDENSGKIKKVKELLKTNNQKSKIRHPNQVSNLVIYDISQEFDSVYLNLYNYVSDNCIKYRHPNNI